MERTVSIGTYDPAAGLHLEWTPGFRIDVQARPGEVVIKANDAGLVSLAQHLLTLADSAVPAGTHVHLDAARELEDASSDLVIERAG